MDQRREEKEGQIVAFNPSSEGIWRGGQVVNDMDIKSTRESLLEQGKRPMFGFLVAGHSQQLSEGGNIAVNVTIQHFQVL